MANHAKRTSAAPSYHYYLGSYEINSGDLQVRCFEPRIEAKPLTLRDYARELHEFCERNATEQEREEWLDEHCPNFDDIELRPYDDRMYRDPALHEITEAEYDVLRKYLR